MDLIIVQNGIMRLLAGLLLSIGSYPGSRVKNRFQSSLPGLNT